ncbi:MAG: hypothetical protein JSW11_20440 [Candidatus Heimdallarchaeota archaeon]|nr:MAG: hypothetical protein JSW11_20440 [Candidatus Heimdallarchaeota archaeon]
MYNINDSVNIKIIDSMKNVVLISLVILLALVLLGGYFLPFFIPLEGRELGRIIFPLFILSEIPILVNYFFFVINRFGLISNTLSQLFIRYYTSSLIFHSGIFTIVLGITFLHSVVVIQQSVFCLLLLLILGFLWVIEFLFWFINWPLYPQKEKNVFFLYFFHWIVLFGLLIGLPFHARAWSLIWVCIFSPLSFGSLLVIIFQEIRNRKRTGQTIGKSEKQSLVT